MYAAVWPLRISETVFYPLAALLRGIASLPHALLARKAPPGRPAVTADSFRFYLTESAAQGILSPFQRVMAENIMRLKSVPLRSAMTPLEQAVMIEEGAPWDELEGLLTRLRYSRIPVYRKSRQDIVGLVSIMDVAQAGPGPHTVQELARGVMARTESTSVADALWALRQAKQHLAVVADRNGAAVGIVTVKDLVEEIVGELAAW
jgi:putative hemolysin